MNCCWIYLLYSFAVSRSAESTDPRNIFELKCVTGSLKVWATLKPSRLFPTGTKVWLMIILILIPGTKYNNASDPSLSTSLPSHAELSDISVFCPWGSTISSLQMRKIAMMVKKIWFVNSCVLQLHVWYSGILWTAILSTLWFIW